jgi:large subunit ribosomal protein L9
MNIVLHEDVKGLGYRGDIVKVAIGYARNFLLPRGIGKIATPAQVGKAEKLKAERVTQHAEVAENAERIAKELEGKSVSFSRKVSGGTKLFGGISEHDIADALLEQAKIEIDKSQIRLEGGHIKTVGEHTADIHLHEGKHARIKVIVEAA